jgi:hypothetical protein
MQGGPTYTYLPRVTEALAALDEIKTEAAVPAGGKS